MSLEKSVEIAYPGRDINLDLSFIDGMIGALPVFEKIEDAEKYSNGKFKIFAIKIKDVKDDQEKV